MAVARSDTDFYQTEGLSSGTLHPARESGPVTSTLAPTLSVRATSTMARIPITKLSDRLQLRKPLYVSLIEEEGAYIVSDQVTHRVADGSTPADALESYREVLATYYDTLVTNKAHLAPPAARDLEALQEYIEPTA